MTKIHTYVSRKRSSQNLVSNDLGDCYCAPLTLDSTIFEGG